MCTSSGSGTSRPTRFCMLQPLAGDAYASYLSVMAILMTLASRLLMLQSTLRRVLLKTSNTAFSPVIHFSRSPVQFIPSPANSTHIWLTVPVSKMDPFLADASVYIARLSEDLAYLPYSLPPAPIRPLIPPVLQCRQLPNGSRSIYLDIEASSPQLGR